MEKKDMRASVMKEEECQAVLDGGSGRRLEGSGFRVYVADRAMVVQDLYEGEFERFGTYTLRATRQRPVKMSAVGGKRAAIERSRVVPLQLRVWIEGLDPDQAVPTGALAAVLIGLEEDHPTEVSAVIPTPDALRARLYPYPWESPDEGRVRGALKVVSALAMLGGECYKGELVQDLSERGVDMGEAEDLLALLFKRGVVARRREPPGLCYSLIRR